MCRIKIRKYVYEIETISLDSAIVKGEDIEVYKDN